MTKPADKWMDMAREALYPLPQYLHELQFLATARALEATDKAATERAAQVADKFADANRKAVPFAPYAEGRAHASEAIAAAIRKGTDNGQG